MLPFPSKANYLHAHTSNYSINKYIKATYCCFQKHNVYIGNSMNTETET